MNFINRLFTSSPDSENQLDWIPLTNLAQLDEAIELSAHKKVMIFKHSTRCGISSMVLKQFEKKFQPDENSALYFLDLLRHRDISNAVADRFQVVHQSPQLLVIENGVCTAHASHYGVVEMVE